MRVGPTVGIAIAGVSGVALGMLALGRRKDERKIAGLWQELAVTGERLQPRIAENLELPEPARRYFRHAIGRHALPATMVQLRISGTLQAARLLDIEAEQLIVPGQGFVWKAHAKSGAMSFEGADYYFQHDAEVKFRLFGLLPLIKASGPGVVRSARGRLVAESIWCPAGLLPGEGVEWQAVDEDSATALITVDGETIPLTITVDKSGRLREAVIPRYNADPANGPLGLTPFGAIIDHEAIFQGYTIPVAMRAGWHYGTAQFRPIFQFNIEEATFR